MTAALSTGPWPIDVDDFVTPLPADAPPCAVLARGADIEMARFNALCMGKHGIYGYPGGYSDADLISGNVFETALRAGCGNPRLAAAAAALDGMSALTTLITISSASQLIQRRDQDRHDAHQRRAGEAT